jgi:hypothetical protein
MYAFDMVPMLLRVPQHLESLKEHIRTSQVRADLAVSRDLVLLYWSIARDILARQKREGWGVAAGINDASTEELLERVVALSW